MQKAVHNLSALMFWPVTSGSPGDQGGLSVNIACISSAESPEDYSYGIATQRWQGLKKALLRFSAKQLVKHRGLSLQTFP